MQTEDLAIFFNSQDKDELKQSFKNILIEQFRGELQELDTYLFDPDKISGMIEDVYEECILEIKDDLRKMIKKQFKESLSKISEDSIIKIINNE